jgi:hypothetical protein
MRDCGVALPYARLVDPCLSPPCNIQGVLDLLSNGLDITAPVRATPRPADTTATSNENRSASLGHRPASMFWHLLTQFGSINEHTGWIAQCPRTERQKSSLGDAGLECCGELSLRPLTSCL